MRDVSREGARKKAAKGGSERELSRYVTSSRLPLPLRGSSETCDTAQRRPSRRTGDGLSESRTQQPLVQGRGMAVEV